MKVEVGVGFRSGIRGQCEGLGEGCVSESPHSDGSTDLIVCGGGVNQTVNTNTETHVSRLLEKTKTKKCFDLLHLLCDK